MNDYTPTPDEAFDATLYTWLDWKGTFENESDARAAWDRMVAEIERAAAEKAWSKGHAAGRDYQGDGWNSDAHDPEEDNPYRTVALGLTAGQEGEGA